MDGIALRNLLSLNSLVSFMKPVSKIMKPVPKNIINKYFFYFIKNGFRKINKFKTIK